MRKRKSNRKGWRLSEQTETQILQDESLPSNRSLQISKSLAHHLKSMTATPEQKRPQLLLSEDTSVSSITLTPNGIRLLDQTYQHPASKKRWTSTQYDNSSSFEPNESLQDVSTSPEKQLQFHRQHKKVSNLHLNSKVFEAAFTRSKSKSPHLSLQHVRKVIDASVGDDDNSPVLSKPFRRKPKRMNPTTFQNAFSETSRTRTIKDVPHRGKSMHDEQSRSLEVTKSPESQPLFKRLQKNVALKNMDPKVFQAAFASHSSESSAPSFIISDGDDETDSPVLSQPLRRRKQTKVDPLEFHKVFEDLSTDASNVDSNQDRPSVQSVESELKQSLTKKKMAKMNDVVIRKTFEDTVSKVTPLQESNTELSAPASQKMLKKRNRKKADPTVFQEAFDEESQPSSNELLHTPTSKLETSFQSNQKIISEKYSLNPEPSQRLIHSSVQLNEEFASKNLLNKSVSSPGRITRLSGQNQRSSVGPSTSESSLNATSLLHSSSDGLYHKPLFKRRNKKMDLKGFQGFEDFSSSDQSAQLASAIVHNYSSDIRQSKELSNKHLLGEELEINPKSSQEMSRTAPSMTQMERNQDLSEESQPFSFTNKISHLNKFVTEDKLSTPVIPLNKSVHSSTRSQENKSSEKFMNTPSITLIPKLNEENLISSEAFSLQDINKEKLPISQKRRVQLQHGESDQSSSSQENSIHDKTELSTFKSRLTFKKIKHKKVNPRLFQKAFEDLGNNSLSSSSEGNVSEDEESVSEDKTTKFRQKFVKMNRRKIDPTLFQEAFGEEYQPSTPTKFDFSTMKIPSSENQKMVSENSSHTPKSSQVLPHSTVQPNEKFTSKNLMNTLMSSGRITRSSSQLNQRSNLEMSVNAAESSFAIVTQSTDQQNEGISSNNGQGTIASSPRRMTRSLKKVMGSENLDISESSATRITKSADQQNGTISSSKTHSRIVSSPRRKINLEKLDIPKSSVTEIIQTSDQFNQKISSEKLTDIFVNSGRVISSIDEHNQILNIPLSPRSTQLSDDSNQKFNLKMLSLTNSSSSKMAYSTGHPNHIISSESLLNSEVPLSGKELLSNISNQKSSLVLSGISEFSPPKDRSTRIKKKIVSQKMPDTSHDSDFRATHSTSETNQEINPTKLHLISETSSRSTRVSDQKMGSKTDLQTVESVPARAKVSFSLSDGNVGLQNITDILESPPKEDKSGSLDLPDKQLFKRKKMKVNPAVFEEAFKKYILSQSQSVYAISSKKLSDIHKSSSGSPIAARDSILSDVSQDKELSNGQLLEEEVEISPQDSQKTSRNAPPAIQTKEGNQETFNNLETFQDVHLESELQNASKKEVSSKRKVQFQPDESNQTSLFSQESSDLLKNKLEKRKIAREDRTKYYEHESMKSTYESATISEPLFHNDKLEKIITGQENMFTNSSPSMSDKNNKSGFVNVHTIEQHLVNKTNTNLSPTRITNFTLTKKNSASESITTPHQSLSHSKQVNQNKVDTSAKHKQSISNKNEKLQNIPWYHQRQAKASSARNFDYVTKEEKRSKLKTVVEEVKKRNENLLKFNSMRKIDKSANLKTFQTLPKKTVVRKTVHPDLLVNGKPYRPCLKRPKSWATQRLYKLVIQKCAKKFGELKSRRKAEKFVIFLCEKVSIVIRRTKYEKYEGVLEEIKSALYKVGIIKCLMDYFIFIEDYLPYLYRIKAVPCIRAYGKRTGPPWVEGTDLYADLSY